MLTKSQFVDSLKAALPEIFTTKAAADKAFDAFCDILAKGVTESDGVRLPDVGTFSVAKRAARTGRNPQTGAAIKIASKSVVKFSAAKGLKETVNK